MTITNEVIRKKHLKAPRAISFSPGDKRGRQLCQKFSRFLWRRILERKREGGFKHPILAIAYS